MTRRHAVPEDLGPLSGCASELAEAFVSLASDIALVIDAEGVVRSVVQSVSTPISADAEQWIGRPWIETVSADTRRKVELMLGDLKTTGVARRRELNIAAAAAGGSDVPVAFAALRLGALGPVLAVGRDLRTVSAIQQRFLDAQQELERGYWLARQAESRYRLLFQVATDAVLTVDATSLRVIEANHAAATLLGDGAALAGRVATALFERASAGPLRELLAGAGRSGKPAEIHARLPKAPLPVAVSATPFRAADGLRLLVRVRSADPRETDPADTTRTLTLLVDRMSDGVVVTDSGGRIVVANPAFLRLADAGAEDAVRGRPLGDWLGRIDADVTALLVGAHEHGVVHLVCSCLRRAGGELIDVDVTAAMLAEGEQERFGFTLRSRTTRGEPHAAWVQALATLDDSLGKLPLDELMARSKNLLERRFMSTAMQRTRGDAKAAAGLLGISEEQLLQSLGRDAATPDPSRSRPN